MPTLLVIDAQKDRFDGLHPGKKRRVLQNIQDEVTIATINGDGVIFTEWENQKTHLSLLKLVRSYRRVARLTKQGEDGAHDVMEVIKSRRFAKRNIRVCGLYTLGSIKETVSTLSKEWLEDTIIEIAIGACSDLRPYYNFDWTYFLENVVVTDSGRKIPRRRNYREFF